MPAAISSGVGEREDLEAAAHATRPPAASASAASARLAAASVITVSVTRGRSPSCSTRPARGRVLEIDQERGGERPVQAGDADGRRLVAERREHRRRRPAQGLPATIGLTATTRSRRAATAARIPGTARIGSIEMNGLDGAITTTSARGDRVEHAGRRARRLGAVEADAEHRVGVAAADVVRLEVDLALRES